LCISRFSLISGRLVHQCQFLNFLKNLHLINKWNWKSVQDNRQKLCGENHNRRTALNCIILLKSHEHMVVHAFAHETYSSVNFHSAHYFGAKNEITRCILENRISENHYLHFDIGLVFIVIIDNARSIMGIISRGHIPQTRSKWSRIPLPLGAAPAANNRMEYIVLMRMWSRVYCTPKALPNNRRRLRGVNTLANSNV